MDVQPAFLKDLLSRPDEVQRSSLVLKVSSPLKEKLAVASKRAKTSVSVLVEQILESFFEELDSQAKSKLGL